MRRATTVLASVCLAVLLSGCSTAGKETNEDTQETTQTQEQEKLTATSYLTGLPVSETVLKERPLAVMLNNIEAGCPQSATSDAAIIYEAPVEGRITRLMGIFEDYSKLDKVGSIRSSRDYFVYFALEYDAIYAHFGQATPYVGDLLNSERVDNISGAVSGILHPAVNTFYRTSDRKAPHNVYLSGEGVLKDIKKLSYRTTLNDTYQPKFTFNDTTSSTQDEGATDATILYPGGKTNTAANGFSKVEARFEYNADDKLYYRFQYGDKHIDELNGEQLAVTNVVFQYCHGEVRDSKDYLAFGCHGDNGYKVQVFTDGKMTEGTWKREGDNTPAVYLDKNSQPIKLNPGKTWVCIIWDEYGQDVVIE